jgi:hypothetical protein
MEQLQTLKSLYESGYMSLEEYDDRRQQIIDRLTNTKSQKPEPQFLPPSTILPPEPIEVQEPVPSESNLLSFPYTPMELEDKGTSRKELLDSGELFMNDFSFSELFPPSPEHPARPEALTMEQRVELAHVMNNMDPQCMDYIIQMINSTAPNMLQFNEETSSYSFDLSQFDETTLTTLYRYVQTFSSQTQDANSEITVMDPARPHMERRASSPRRMLRRSLSDSIPSRPKRPEPDWEPEEIQEAPEPKRLKTETLEEEEEPLSLSSLFEVHNAPSFVSMLEGEEKNEHPAEVKHEPVEPESKPDSKKIRIKVHIYRVEKSGGGKKPWKCDAEGCTQSFSDSSNLIKHLRTHTKEKPYRCDREGCGKSYAHSTSLKEHMNTHTGEKPFVCTFDGCGMAFAQNSNLRRHMRVHTGDRPFVCQICSKAFSQSTNLKSHIATHSKSETRVN